MTDAERLRLAEHIAWWIAAGVMMLPAWIALIRRHHQRWAIVALSAVGIWLRPDHGSILSFIALVAALIWSLTAKK